MKIRTWHQGMTAEETKDLAYWERNVLALRYADGWYNDDVPILPECVHESARVEDDTGALICRECDEEEEYFVPRFSGWRRVLSLEGGKITFHIPDDFDVGDLPAIERNWDGHTTEEKWRRILEERGVQVTA